MKFHVVFFPSFFFPGQWQVMRHSLPLFRPRFSGRHSLRVVLLALLEHHLPSLFTLFSFSFPPVRTSLNCFSRTILFSGSPLFGKKQDACSYEFLFCLFFCVVPFFADICPFLTPVPFSIFSPFCVFFLFWKTRVEISTK